MIRITVGPQLTESLRSLAEPANLVDGTGRELGRFLPAAQATASGVFSDDEVEWMLGLAKEGLLSPATKPLAANELPMPVKTLRAESIVDTLLADRDED